MGVLCPQCETHQSIVKVHTVDGQPPVKGSDVIFVSLACKHAFGREEFNEYQKIANKIKMDAADRIRDIENQSVSAISTAFSAFLDKRKKGVSK